MIRINFLAIINTLGALQSILLAVVVFTAFKDKPNRQASIFFSAFLITLGIIMIRSILLDTGLYIMVPRFIYHGGFWILLVGPTFYLFIRSLVQGKISIKWKMLFHFLPFALVSLLIIPLYFYPTSELATMLELSRNKTKTLDDYVNYFLFDSHVIIYWFAAYRLIRTADPANPNFFQMGIALRWVKNLMGAFLLIYIASLALHFLPGGQENRYLPSLLTTFLVYGICYISIKQSTLFSGNIRPLGKKYKNSTLNNEKSQEIVNLLEKKFQQEKMYRNSELTLPQLAKLLEVTPHHLSQSINEQYQENFFGFVNRHRIADAKEQLLDTHQNKTIAEIAYDVGFNSLSSFNAAFKKFVHSSPTQFRKENLSEKS